MSLNLLGLGHFHPENEITNQFLEDLDIGTNDEWILERTGIRSRRTALPLDYIRETRNKDPRAAVEAAIEATKDDADREPSYRQRNHTYLAQRMSKRLGDMVPSNVCSTAFF